MIEDCDLYRDECLYSWAKDYGLLKTDVCLTLYPSISRVFALVTCITSVGHCKEISNIISSIMTQLACDDEASRKSSHVRDAAAASTR